MTCAARAIPSKNSVAPLRIVPSSSITGALSQTPVYTARLRILGQGQCIARCL